MSRIITPTDTILIEIDNLSVPPRVMMKPSGNVTNIGAIGIMSSLITELAKEIVRQGRIGPPGMPPATPPAGTTPPKGAA